MPSHVGNQVTLHGPDASKPGRLDASIEKGLRQKAEALAMEMGEPDLNSLTSEEIARLFRELRVHGIELELQNEALRRTQEELARSQVRYHELIEQTPIGQLSLNAEGQILEANLTLATLLGMDQDALIGRGLPQFIVPEDHGIFAEHCHLLFTTRAPQECQVRMVRQDGAVIWVLLIATALQNPESGVPYSRAVLTDITEYIQVEEDLRESERRLQQALTSSGISFWEQTVAPRVLDLNTTVEATLDMLHRMIGEEIDLRWQPGAYLWPVEMDPSQIDQILANLCVNARDAIDGIGTIMIATANIEIGDTVDELVREIDPGDYVMLSVSDDGSGIDHEILEHLFEPFFTTKGVGKGTGLGLATVYGIVKQNRGQIKVSSELGIGTTFDIYLPRFATDVPESPISFAGDVPQGHGETVLLVEDEAAVALRPGVQGQGGPDYSDRTATAGWVCPIFHAG